MHSSSPHRPVAAALVRVVGSLCAIGLFALPASPALGAKPTDAVPAWSRDFTVPIAWQRVTAYGHLLVAMPSGLAAIDPDTGKPRWSLPDLKDVSEDGYAEIAGTPLALIGSGALDSRTVIVNVFNGALVFDSRAERLAKVSSTHVLPEENALLVAGFESGKPQPTLYLYDIETGKRRWSSDALLPGGNKLLGLVMAAALVATDATPVQSEPLELGDGTFVLGAMGNLYRFDGASGRVLWKTAFAGGAYELRRTDARPDVVYAGAEETTATTIGEEQRTFTSTLYQGFRLDDGKAVWKRPVKLNHPMNRLIIPLERGLIASEGDANKGRLQLLDYDSGAGLWGLKGKGLEISGLVLDYLYAGSDLVLTAGYDSVWTNKDTEYLLYVLDPAAGALRFPKPFKVRGRLLSSDLGANGLTYVTTHEIGVFDPATGLAKSGSGLVSRAPLVTAVDDASIYAFNGDDGFVYRFDTATGTAARFSQTPFAFQDRDTARALDVVGGRVVLLGAQTVAGFDERGALAFDVHYAPPRDPAWLRSLAWAEGVRAGMASAYAGAYSAAAASAAQSAAEGSLPRELALGLERGFGDLQRGYAGLASEYVSFARRRYEASAESRDFAFMLIQREDRSVALAQVSKRDGHLMAAIDLGRDKAPEYAVDDVGSLVYYRPSQTAVVAYRFAAETVRVASP